MGGQQRSEICSRSRPPARRMTAMVEVRSAYCHCAVTAVIVAIRRNGSPPQEVHGDSVAHQDLEGRITVCSVQKTHSGSRWAVGDYDRALASGVVSGVDRASLAGVG